MVMQNLGEGAGGEGGGGVGKDGALWSRWKWRIQVIFQGPISVPWLSRESSPITAYQKIRSKTDHGNVVAIAK